MCVVPGIMSLIMPVYSLFKACSEKKGQYFSIFTSFIGYTVGCLFMEINVSMQVALKFYSISSNPLYYLNISLYTLGIVSWGCFSIKFLDSFLQLLNITLKQKRIHFVPIFNCVLIKNKMFWPINFGLIIIPNILLHIG